MKPIMRDQAGTAMVLEVALLALVIGMLGFAGVKAYQAHYAQTADAPTEIISKVKTAPDGRVDSAVNALNSDAASDDSGSAANTIDATQVTATSSAAASIEGSYNEASY